MNVQVAWANGFTGDGVVVTILDDGVDHTHPDLADNYVSTLTLHCVCVCVCHCLCLCVCVCVACHSVHACDDQAVFV